ncbi:transposase [Kibdelosporangium persicum]
MHVAARITRVARRTWLRINQHWPWRHEIATAFARLTDSRPRSTCSWCSA